MCPICHRDLGVLSPKGEELIMRALGEGSLDAAYGPEPLVALRDGRMAHEYCKSEVDFLEEVNPAMAGMRLEGYVKGKTFGGYMNWPFGLDHPAVDSYRQLQAVSVAIAGVEEVWREGRIVEDGQFKIHGHSWYVKDVDFRDTSRLYGFASLAEAVLAFGLVAWRAAHKGSSGKLRRMFLRWDMYTGEWCKKSDYFHNKVDKEIAHNDKNNLAWNFDNTNEPYSPYPNWIEEWKQFTDMVVHSLNLCIAEINNQVGMPERGPLLGLFGCGSSFNRDVVQLMADLVSVFGLPSCSRGTLVEEEYPPAPLGQDGWYPACWEEGKLIVPPYYKQPTPTPPSGT